jgi:predicted DNA-binding ribbon-helix-helix protein
MRKRSITIAGHRTSVALEPEFWTALEAAAARRGHALARLVAEIDEARGRSNLASALRLFVLREATAHGSAGNAAGDGTPTPPSMTVE